MASVNLLPEPPVLEGITPKEKTTRQWAAWLFLLTKAVNSAAAFATTQVAIQFKDEGGNLGAAGTVDTINFTGTALTVTRSVNTVTVDSDQMKFGDILAFAARH